MRIGNDSVAMRTGAPTRLDRAVLAFASGPLGHLLATALEVGSALSAAARARVRARWARRTRR